MGFVFRVMLLIVFMLGVFVGQVWAGRNDPPPLDPPKTMRWVGTDGIPGYWYDARNWDLNLYPQPQDELIFDGAELFYTPIYGISDGGIVNFSNSKLYRPMGGILGVGKLGTLIVDEGSYLDVGLSVDGQPDEPGMITVTGEDTWARVGGVGVSHGEFRLENGATLEIKSYGGISAGNGGLVVIDGANTKYSKRGKLYLSGGVIEVTGGADVSVREIYVEGDYYDEAGGTFRVSGEGSHLTDRNFETQLYGPDIRIEVLAGARFSSNRLLLQGSEPDVMVAKVDGDGSLLEAHEEIALGDYYKAKLEITNGGRVTTPCLRLSDYDSYYEDVSSEVVVDGAGSQLVIDGELKFGQYGPKSIAITNGGRMSNTSTAGQGNTVMVSGPGSVWENNDSYSGPLTVSDFGKVVIDHVYNPSKKTAAVGSGGLLQIGEGLAMNDIESVVDVRGGSINVGTVAESATDTLRIGTDGELYGGGTVYGDVVNDGFIQFEKPFYYYWYETPGSELPMAIEGDFSQGDDGTLEFNKYGRVGPSWAAYIPSKLTVSGQAELDGKLEVEFFDERYIKPSFSHEIIVAGSVAGEFDEVDILLNCDDICEQPGIWGEVRYEQTGVFIDILATPGDADLDGVVGLADLEILGQYFGKKMYRDPWVPGVYSLWERGDFNNDGDIDLLDLDLIGQYFGQSVTAPEPGMLGLLLLSVGVGVVRRR